MNRAIPLLFVCCLGCSSDEADAPVSWLKVNQVDAPPPTTEEAPPAYEFDFLAPKDHSVPPGAPIPYRFTLKVPEGAKPPSSVFLQLMRGGSAADTKGIEPEGAPVRGRYSFEGSMVAPTVPGRYQFRVQAIIGTLYLGEPLQPDVKYTYAYSPPIDITVEKGR